MLPRLLHRTSLNCNTCRTDAPGAEVPTITAAAETDTPVPSQEAQLIVTATPIAEPSIEAAPTPSPEPTNTPTSTPMRTATPKPTRTPSPKPTSTPSPTPIPSYTVPSFGTRSNAESWCNEHNISLSVSEEYSWQNPEKGTVLSNVNEGSTVSYGGSISIVVSKGVKPLATNDIVRVKSGTKCYSNSYGGNSGTLSANVDYKLGDIIRSPKSGQNYTVYIRGHGWVKASAVLQRTN